MSTSLSGRSWEDASSPLAARAAQAFEADWQAAPPNRRPDPMAYLRPGDPIGTRLALLRAEMSLCFEAGETVRAEGYRTRYPDLDDETLVALIYEEFCLREEAGQDPRPPEYYRRFPAVTDRLKRVLDVHDLILSSAPASFPPSASTVPFPETGQTIAGFRLVEELGRGAFARVFRAEERQLADRPVALKVSRTGSREPRMLARLQHTHIVPVYSYRTDQATGLHLLCMPYLGGVTLARLLADPQVRHARMGQEVLAALDRLEPSGRLGPRQGAAGRRALGRRNYVRAIAWWGSRLAEALQHAHERGILHRDLKPSNVLVTGDGVPMLLDFNLAWESRIDDLEVESATLGGTIAYMSPEHLDSLVEGGDPAAIDARSDIYSLGIMLYEAMGTRPFESPRSKRSLIEVLVAVANERRRGVVPLRDRHPEVPVEFEAVVHRCLAPDPAHRYTSATELAADLQAVADDGPLVYAREPLISSTFRWGRRNGRWLAIVTPILLLMGVVTYFVWEQRREQGRLTDDVREIIHEGMTLADGDQLDQAKTRLDLAAQLAAQELAGPAASPGDEARRWVRLSGTLEDLRSLAREQSKKIEDTQRKRAEADKLADQAELLRPQLLGLIHATGDPSSEIEAILKPFYVLSAPFDAIEKEAGLLDRARHDRLWTDVEDLLYLWTLAIDRQMDGLPDEDRRALARRALTYCERGQEFTSTPGPWSVLQSRMEAIRDGRTPESRDEPADHPSAESSHHACFQWALLRVREGRIRDAIHWLEHATWLKQDQFWYQSLLAHLDLKISEIPEQDQALDLQHALAHVNVAIALQAKRAWPRYQRARVYQSLGAWSLALADLQSARESASPLELPWILIDLATVHQALGEVSAAQSALAAVMDVVSPDDPLMAKARRRRAELDLENGFLIRARSEFDAILADDPRNMAARHGRAMVALRSGRPQDAEADLTTLVNPGPAKPDWLAARAEARLRMGQIAEADADAAAAEKLDPRPARLRLRLRTRLALGQLQDVRLTAPEELIGLPVGGPALQADLRRAARSLEKTGTYQGLGTRAVLLAALGDRSDALRAADEAVVKSPGVARVFLVRAHVRFHFGDLEGARRDLTAGLALEPDDPRLLGLLARVHLRSGDPSAALEDLDHALRYQADWSLQADRARALMDLKRPDAAYDAWTAAIALDPDDPRGHLGRARVDLALQQYDDSRADLENAVRTSGQRPGSLLAISLEAARSLPEQPDRTTRVLELALRGLTGLVRSGLCPDCRP